MSNNSHLPVKKERGTSLTLEQYDLLAAFLKHGIRPNRKSLKNAGLVGTLNGGQGSGKPKVPFARFKSIAKRLTYRESDGELVFKANSKIVIPNNRFEEAILQAHRSRGNKHLNLTRTIQTLGDKYTIGCRQFGISEERVRMVIRRCQDGSCANKNKTEMGVLKHFAKTEKPASSKTSTCSLKDTSSTGTKRPDKNPASVIKVPVINSIPMTVVRLPNGTFGIQPTSNISGFTPFKQVSLFNTRPSGTVVQPQHSHGQAIATNMARMTPNMPYTSTENTVSNPVPVPVQLVQIGSQPLMVGQQICLFNGGTCLTNWWNTGQNQPLDLSKESQPLNLSVRALISQAGSVLDNTKQNSNGSLSVPQDSCGISGTRLSNLDQNNNEILMGEVDTDNKGNKGQGKLQQNATRQPLNGSSALDTFRSYLDPCNYGNHEETIDLTEPCQEDKEMFEGSDLQEDTNVGVDSTGQDIDGSCTLAPVPYPKIWYYYDDLSRETNPYERISMCIKDMKLDLMLSLAGSLQATEKMRKKMHYIQDLVTAQQNVTQYFTDLYSTV